MKKHILLLCMIAVMFLFCAACGNNNLSKNTTQILSDNSIIIWAWDENFNIHAANRAIEKYKKSHDVEIEVVNISQEEIVAKLKSAIISGTDELFPDIVLIEDYRIQYFLKNYEEEFEELGDIFSEEDFASYKMGVNQVDGRIYGVPFDSGVVGLFYRLDYIEAAGYTQNDMRNLTWSKYVEIGKKVKQVTGKDMLTLDPSDLPLVRMMLQSAGEWYCDSNGRIKLVNNKALYDAIEVYASIVEADIAKPVSDWSQFIASFQSGEVASVVSGAWIASSISESSEQSGLWRVAEFPRMEQNENSINASSVGGSGWYVMKNSKHAKEAKQFLKETFASDHELIETLVEEINLVSTLKSMETSETYKNGTPFYGNQTIFSSFIQWTYKIPSVNYGEDTYDIEEYVAGAIQKILSKKNILDTLKEYQGMYLQDTT